jgi:hypothetical protein
LIGFNYPVTHKQFGGIWLPDECDKTHYHGASGYTLDLKNIPETDSARGFGDNVTIIDVSGQQVIDWFHNRPKNF